MQQKKTITHNAAGKMIHEYTIQENSNIYQTERLPLLVEGEVFPISGIFHKLPKISPDPPDTFLARLKEEMQKVEAAKKWYVSMTVENDIQLKIAEKQLSYLQKLSETRFRKLSLYSQVIMDLNDKPNQDNIIKALSKATISLEMDPYQTSDLAICCLLDAKGSPSFKLGDLYKKCPELEGFGITLNIYQYSQVYIGIKDGKFAWKYAHRTGENYHSSTYMRGPKGELLPDSLEV